MASEYSPGLEGVMAGISGISEVDPIQNTLIYRGYDARELVEKCSFEEVAYLVLYGDLPTHTEYDAFTSRIKAQRDVPSSIYDLYRSFDNSAHPMDTLKAAVAVLAAQAKNASDISESASLAAAESLLAKIPTLVVNGYRVTHGDAPRPPSKELDHNQNFFYMLTGGEPNPMFNKALNATQILYIEHGFNASTFSSRVTVSTLADLYCGVVSAIGTLKGPLHGGANEHAMAMLLEIGTPERAEAWVDDALTNKKKIMGFGHREYKKGDSRAVIVKKHVQELSDALGNRKWIEISDIVEAKMLAAKNLYPNVDFPVASTYYLMDIPVELYTPMFVMSRVVGWSANIIEQLANNRIFRPQSEYNGPHDKKVTPLAARV